MSVLTDLGETIPLTGSEMAKGVADFFDTLRTEQVVTRGKDALLVIRMNHPRPRIVPTVEMLSVDGAEFCSSALDPLEALDQICEQMLNRSSVSDIIRADLRARSALAVEQFLARLTDVGSSITPAGERVSFSFAIGLHEASPCGRIIFFGDRISEKGISGRIASHEIAAGGPTMQEVLEELYYKASDSRAIEQYRRPTSKVA